MAIHGALTGASAVSSNAEDNEINNISCRPLFIIIGSVILYGILMRPLGVYLSSLILVILGSTASHEFKWKVAIINAICLTVAVHFIFIVGLGLIFPLWPSFLGMN